VFNVEQIDGLPETYYAKAESQLTPIEGIARAEEFFSHIPVTLRHGGNRAYYAQELDYVQMPIIEAFHDAESYYATLGHEFEGVFSIRSRERPCKDCQPGRSPADHNLE
jgi:antirestriction protein ArdC